MRVELAREHALCEIHVPQVPDGGGVNPAPVFHHQVDHCLVRRTHTWGPAAVCRSGWRAGCEHLGVWIGAVCQQHARHVDPSGVDRLQQRAARRERLIFMLA